MVFGRLDPQKLGMHLLGILAVCTCILMSWQPASAAGNGGSILDDVRARGYINCGVSNRSPGFSVVDEQGQWSGLDVDYCAALATAVLGDKTAVKYIPLTNGKRFRALRAGDVDVIPRDVSWTLSRDTELGVRFVGVLFHDGQGFLARRTHIAASIFELSGASICLLLGTQSERAVRDFFESRNMPYQLVTSENWADLVEIYAKGGCTTLTGDASLLARVRVDLEDPKAHAVLPELITKEPMGPAVRAGDDRWFSIVRWTLMALIAGEELGIKSENVSAMQRSNILEVRRFLGLEANLGQSMGLAHDWALQVIRQVGNYGEIFEKNLGARSILGLSRGLNKLWNDGGLHYAAPFR